MLLHEKLSYKIRGCALNVRKNFGPGHKEVIYQRAFEEELKTHGIEFKKEVSIDIYSPKTGKVVGKYCPDFIIEDKVLVEVKSANLLTKQILSQLYSYLRNSKYELGFLINFGGKRLTIKRVIYSNEQKPWFKRLNSPCLSVSSSVSIRGTAYRFGDNVNTDDIYPGRYLSITTDRQEMAKHCFELAYPDFLKNAKPGDIIVAGKNFGCGSSREQAATCLKYFGISVVIAESFARIFYRNAINLGLPILIAPDITKKVEHNDPLEVELEKGIIKNMRTNEEIKGIPLPSFVLEILNEGGLVPYLKKKLSLTEKGGGK